MAKIGFSLHPVAEAIRRAEEAAVLAPQGQQSRPEEDRPELACARKILPPDTSDLPASANTHSTTVWAVVRDEGQVKPADRVRYVGVAPAS